MRGLATENGGAVPRTASARVFSKLDQPWQESMIRGARQQADCPARMP